MENFNNLSLEGRIEIIDYIIEELKNNCLLSESIKDRYGDLNGFHSKLFNEDYYFVGYYQSEQWIKNNCTYGVFNAIDTVLSYEKDNSGESYTKIDSESIANMLVYIIGEEILYSLDEDSPIEDIIEELKNL